MTFLYTMIAVFVGAFVGTIAGISLHEWYSRTYID